MCRLKYLVLKVITVYIQNIPIIHGYFNNNKIFPHLLCVNS